VLFVGIRENIMVTMNLSDIKGTGSASMQNGDFLTFDGLPNNQYSMIIPSLPNVQFFLQKFSLPSVSVKSIDLYSRIVDYNEIGEKINYEPFTVTFLVDKYSRNWASVFNWMKSMTADGSNIGHTDDVDLLINNQPLCRFMGSWPMILSGFEFDTTVEGLVYIKSTLTMNYDYMDYTGTFQTVDSQYS